MSRFTDGVFGGVCLALSGLLLPTTVPIMVGSTIGFVGCQILCRGITGHTVTGLFLHRRQ